jgi:hypothetical protein
MEVAGVQPFAPSTPAANIAQDDGVGCSPAPSSPPWTTPGRTAYTAGVHPGVLFTTLDHAGEDGVDGRCAP